MLEKLLVNKNKHPSVLSQGCDTCGLTQELSSGASLLSALLLTHEFLRFVETCFVPSQTPQNIEQLIYLYFCWHKHQKTIQSYTWLPLLFFMFLFFY